MNILGTNGSGKTTLVRLLMAHYGHEPVYEELGGKQYHEAHAVDGGRIMVVGPYPEGRTVGGVDKLSGYPDERGRRSTKGNIDRAEHLVRKYMVQPGCQHVVFEALTTHGFARWHGFSMEFPGQFIWSTMDTPLETCIARVYARNGGKPIQEDTMRGVVEHEQRSLSKAAAAGDLVYEIDHTRPLENLLWILEDGAR